MLSGRYTLSYAKVILTECFRPVDWQRFPVRFGHIRADKLTVLPGKAKAAEFLKTFDALPALYDVGESFLEDAAEGNRDVDAGQNFTVRGKMQSGINTAAALMDSI